jgi:membrane fusion protein, multidrug efflux system
MRLGQLVLFNCSLQWHEHPRPLIADGRTTVDGTQFGAESGQRAQALLGRVVSFICQIVCCSCEVVDGGDGRAQMGRAKPAGDGKVFVVFDAHAAHCGFAACFNDSDQGILLTSQSLECSHQFAMPRNSTFPIAATIAIALLSGCAKPVAEPEPVRPVRSVVVNEGATQATREYAAEIKARTETRLSFQVPGKLVRRMVEVGQSVKLGQPLAQLEPQDAQLSAQAAVAAREGAEANLALAQADLARFKQLKEQGFISGAELERREASLKAARAQADQARAQQTLTSNQAGYTVLLASAAGIVTAVEAEPGMVLAAGTPVLKIAHDGPRDAVIAVPEAEAAAFTQWARNPGQFTVQGWAQQAAAVPAQVREVSASADPATRTFNVKLDVGSTTNLMLGPAVTAQWGVQPAVAGLCPDASARGDTCLGG